MPVALIENLMMIIPQVLHEDVQMGKDGGFYTVVVQPNGDKDARSPRTKCPQVQALNESRARNSEGRIEGYRLGVKNSSIKVYTCGWTAFFFLWNSSANMSATIFKLYMRKPKNEEEMDIDHGDDLTKHYGYFRDTSSNAKLFQYIDYKRNFKRNFVRMGEALDRYTVQNAPHHKESRFFITGNVFHNQTPSTMHRLIYKDTYDKFEQNQMISLWNEVKSDNGVVSYDKVPTIIEGFVELPPLLYSLQHRCQNERRIFLEMVNMGNASQKIYEMVKYFKLENLYPMRWNKEKERAEFFVPGCLNDETLEEHKVANEKVRRKHVKGNVEILKQHIKANKARKRMRDAKKEAEQAQDHVRKMGKKRNDARGEDSEDASATCDPAESAVAASKQSSKKKKKKKKKRQRRSAD